MSRYTLIHRIFNAVSPTHRGLNRRGDHLVRLVSGATVSSGIHVYATLERLSEADLVSVAEWVGIRVRGLEAI